MQGVVGLLLAVVSFVVSVLWCVLNSCLDPTMLLVSLMLYNVVITGLVVTVVTVVSFTLLLGILVLYI